MKRKSEWTAKILTLITAIFLWSYVMSEENPEIINRYRNVTVTYANTSALDKQGLVIMAPEEVKIDVRVTGQKTDMDKFLASNIFAQVDLSGYSEGQVKIPITVGLLDQTSGISVVSFEPREVLFTFDRIITKEIPITITTTGELPSTYVLGDILARPQSILLRGPRTWVNEVASAIALLDISGKTETMSLSVPIKAVDDSGEEVRGVDKEPGIIDMTLPVFKTALAPIQLVTENELPEGMALVDINVSPAEIMIKGDNLVDLVEMIETMPIDVNTLFDKNSAELVLSLPDGVTLLDPSQKIIMTYKVEETVEATHQFSFEQVSFVHVEEGLKLEEIQKDLVFTVVLKGYKDILEDFDIVAMLKPTIDLAGLGVGSHELEISFEEIPNLSIETILPGTITVNLIED